jgi:hypothetical protein
MNNRTTDTPAAPFRSQEQPTTNSSLFGRRAPARPSAMKTIDEAAIASNPWAAKAAAANGIKVEEKLNFESDKQFPSLSSGTPAPKKGAWGSSTVTAAALAADWAAKDAEEKAEAAAAKLRAEEEAAHLAEQRRQYTTFNPSRSDVFRHEIYHDNEEEFDDRYSYEEQTYEYQDNQQEEFQEEENRNDNW